MENLNISVVIPNYNGVHLFPETLPTVFEALTETGLLFEVIVVDDCSTDNSVEYLSTYFPEIIICQNDTNSGFSKTINRGIFTAKNKLVLLLNSDVKLTPGYFKNQLAYFEKLDTFGVNGQTLGWHDNHVQDAGKFPIWHGFKLKFSNNYLPPSDNKPNYSLYLSGANCLADRQKLLELNGFNEDFSPFYVEDVDLSVRAWRRGWKCYFEPSVVCRHKTSTTIAQKEKREYVKLINHRNKLYFHHFHLNGWRLAGWRIQTALELIVRILFFQFWYYRAFTEYLLLRSSLQLKKTLFAQKTHFELKEITGFVKINAARYRKHLFKS